MLITCGPKKKSAYMTASQTRLRGASHNCPCLSISRSGRVDVGKGIRINDKCTIHDMNSTFITAVLPVELEMLREIYT